MTRERWASAHLFCSSRGGTTNKALAEVESLAREIAGSLGVEVVSIVYHAQGHHSQLRIDIDRAGPDGVDLGDCERMSRALDERLEALGILDTTYELQVSSPGIDRPIRTADDLRRNAGRSVWAQFRDAQGQVRECRGVLVWDQASGRVTVVDGPMETELICDRIILMKQDVRPTGRKRIGR